MDSVALLVVDAQDCFIDTLHNKEDFLIRTAFAIEAARCLKIHTIFTEQGADKLGSTNPRLLSLARKPKVFHKRCFSALAAPGVEQYLRDREIYHLLVVGLETPVCIYQTGLQAADEDIDITFFTDAIGARRQEDEARVIDELRRQGCHFLPSETVFYSLLRDVTNPYFRVFNGLVKNYGDKTFDAEEFKSAAPKSETDTEIDDQESPPRGETKGAEAEDRDQSQSANRRRRRPRRRRGRGDDRAKEGQAPNQQESEEKPSDSKQSSPVASTSEEKTSKERPPKRRKKKSEQAARESAESPDSIVDKTPAKETPSDSDTKPAKKAAKKAVKKTATKKAAKKAAKKVAKKAAKKVARKTAKKTAETPSSE